MASYLFKRRDSFTFYRVSRLFAILLFNYEALIDPLISSKLELILKGQPFAHSIRLLMVVGGGALAHRKVSTYTG